MAVVPLVCLLVFGRESYSIENLCRHVLILLTGLTPYSRDRLHRG